MFGFGRLSLRQVQAALDDGRLEEAQRLLAQPSIVGHRRHGELLRELVRRYVERGERRLRQDNAESAWHDLLRAEQLAVSDRTADALRQALTRLGLAQVRGLLSASNPRQAGHVLGQLRDRNVRGSEMTLLEEAASNWLSALDLADQGDFGAALRIVERMQRLVLGPAEQIDALQRSLTERQRDCAGRLARLYEAIDAGRWRDVLELAEGVLVLAPQHAEARRARARAWQTVEPITVADRPRPETSDAAVRDDGSPQRYFLWVDGVGGYLICLSANVTLGQASPGTSVDVPLMADVSRLHASVSRDADGGYLLESSRPIQVNGETVTRRALRPGDRVTLGATCQLRFHKPVPVSSSARLDLASGHRSLPGIDGVLLMADTLVLGPTDQSHVRVPELKQPVVLFRTRDGLGVRYSGVLIVDGEKIQDRTMLKPTSHVGNDVFAMAIEPASRK